MYLYRKALLQNSCVGVHRETLTYNSQYYLVHFNLLNFDFHLIKF